MSHRDWELDTQGGEDLKIAGRRNRGRSIHLYEVGGEDFWLCESSQIEGQLVSTHRDEGSTALVPHLFGWGIARRDVRILSWTDHISDII